MVNKVYKYHFIYKTTNLINGKYYIGMHSTDDLNDGYIGSGKILRRSIAKYGIKNFKFQILEQLPSRKLLKKREEELVNEEQIKNLLCMNLQLGGGGGFIDENHAKKCHEGSSKYQKKKWKNKEYRNKIVSLLPERIKRTHKAGKLKYDNFKGKKHTKKTRERMSASKKGKCVGKKNSQFGTCWIIRNEVNKKIKIENLQIFLNQGWIRGRFKR